MHKKVTLYVVWLQNDTGIWEYSELLWIGDRRYNTNVIYIFFGELQVSYMNTN